MVALIVDIGEINARETETTAVPMWYVNMSRMLVDQVEEYLTDAADVSRSKNDRKGHQGVLAEFFIGCGNTFYIANEYFDPVSIKSSNPDINKTSVMPYDYFFDEISSKEWPRKINYEFAKADYYIMEVESVKDLGDNEVLCTGTVYKLNFSVNRDKSLRISDRASKSWKNASVRCEKRLYNGAPEVTVGETLFLGLGDTYVVELEVR